MTTYDEDVVSFEVKDGKKGKYLTYQTNGKGKAAGKLMSSIVFGDDLAKKFHDGTAYRPGRYKIGKEKNGKFNNVVSVEYLGPLSSDSSKPNPAPEVKQETALASQGAGAPGAMAISDAGKRQAAFAAQDAKAHDSEWLRNRAITAQVAIKAAAEIVAAYVGGGLKPDDAEGMADRLTQKFMDRASGFMLGPATIAATTPAPEGKNEVPNAPAEEEVPF